jgi:uncharacterized membrane protein YozB (DUF420 family)
MTENVELEDGTVSVTWLVQLVPLHEGMLTVVVELVTELKAFCTSDAEQLAALIVWALAPVKALNRKTSVIHLFTAMVRGAPFLFKYLLNLQTCPQEPTRAKREGLGAL